MEKLVQLLEQIEKVPFTNKWACIERLDNVLQDVLIHLEAMNHKASGEWIELKSCSWVLHERYHMDSEEQMKWTFHHTKHKMIRSCRSLLEKMDNNKKRVVVDLEGRSVGESAELGLIEFG
ncbi:MAG: hypothetical protein JNK73_05980 [Bacteroidia bacterium]|nr:hypothetical protein [Bacteroidia bacterium]